MPTSETIYWPSEPIVVRVPSADDNTEIESEEVTEKAISLSASVL